MYLKFWLLVLWNENLSYKLFLVYIIGKYVGIKS